jgi:hypothetical protein
MHCSSEKGEKTFLSFIYFLVYTFSFFIYCLPTPPFYLSFSGPVFFIHPFKIFASAPFFCRFFLSLLLFLPLSHCFPMPFIWKSFWPKASIWKRDLLNTKQGCCLLSRVIQCQNCIKNFCCLLTARSVMVVTYSLHFNNFTVSAYGIYTAVMSV